MNRNTLLIVDDMEVNRAILKALFEQEYNLLEAENGEQALALIERHQDTLAGILLDLVMPVKDGYQVMAELARGGLLARLPVIIITAENSIDNEVRAFDLGASDIIFKPFEPHVVRLRVRNAVELSRHRRHLEEMVEEQAAKLRETRDVIMDTLSSVIEHRSTETGQHVLRIRKFTKVLLKDVMRFCPEYDLNERTIGVIAEASTLHDIGKISIPDTILNKPGRLTPEEFEVMKTHAVKGCEILSGLDRMGDKAYLGYAYNICRYHHERWDGLGYPDGLKGDNTPVYAQAVGIADAYDALTTDRVYKKAIPPEKAVTMILEGACGAFSPKLLECFAHVREQFCELARSYADGHIPKTEERPRESSPVQYMNMENTPELGQMKYLALLRYMESTVMEVDLDSGAYNLIHQENEDFQDLRSGGTFEESFRAFAEGAVHPEDRAGALEMLDSYIRDFFSNGLMKQTRRYRVLHRASGEYVWHEGTALRVDIDNPWRHKVMFVWKQAARNAALSRIEASGGPDAETLLAAVLQCRNDQWLTVTYVNEAAATLLGYSKRELQERFENRFIELIHPDDRGRVRRGFMEQAASCNAGELEYRVLTKREQARWVLAKCRASMGEDGMEYIDCVLTDIDRMKRDREELSVGVERYRLIQEQTNDIIFEGDLKSGDVVLSSNWEKKFGYAPLAQNIEERLQTASHLYPEDVPALREMMKGIAEGVPYGEAEVRIAKADGKYLWCRFRVTAQPDGEGKPAKLVGVIQDIDSERRRTQELIHRAEQESLTKLYTKNAAYEIIGRTLKRRTPSERFAMLIIDLDNFKQINDSRGHMFGDAVLSEVANRIKSLFRAGDTIARFGGDEFLVFLRYRSGGEFLADKAASVVQAIRAVFPEDLRECLTCSVGVSRCPEDGADVQTLFQRCDQALYQAKLRGKDQVAFFDGATMSKIFGLNAEQVYAAGTRIESDGDADDSAGDSIVPQSFKLLYQSGDVETAVGAILEMVGRKFDLGRVYVFENSEDGTWCQNTFEWCNEGVRPARDALRHVNYEDLGRNYRENFDENGIFYCRDIFGLPQEQYELLAAQGIRSMLQCEVRDKGKFMGFVGFDDCANLRMWTRRQIDALTFLSELLSTFLLKKREEDRALKAVRDLQAILDDQNAMIYVIDPDSFSLHYVNAASKRAVPGARPGMRCYEVFFHRDSPCTECPARGIRTFHHQTLELYNPVLGIWSMVEAGLTQWSGQDACLLASHDITEYKKADDGRAESMEAE